ncbi:hypothetical protein EHM92_06470 [bacterium]|nr:MAG: hypothetical protein EHM92_06470 [bacterium]
MRLHVIAIVLALPLLSLVAAPPAASQVQMEFGMRFGPPSPRYEVVTAPPFQHAVWIRGHWGWNDYAGRYVWIRGHWIARRPAYTWVDGGWHRGPRGWYWNEGRWEHNGNGKWDRDYDREKEHDNHPGKGRGNGHGRGKH